METNFATHMGVSWRCFSSQGNSSEEVESLRLAIKSLELKCKDYEQRLAASAAVPKASKAEKVRA